MTIVRSVRSGGLVGAVVAVGLAGCAGSGPAQEAVAPATDMAQAGARIWSITCSRCHNLRAPSEFAAAEWPIVVNHMRTRQELTRSEAEAVSMFLQELAEASDSP